MKLRLIILTALFKFSLCRDYYVGMFKKNDLLVAQDTVYKEKNFFGFTTAKYGRVFTCPITYFRVSDRLGVGRPPAVKVTRGGLQKKYITLLLTSSYKTPIAVNIYIGCENKITTRTTTTATTAAKADVVEGETTTVAAEAEAEAKGDTTAITTAAGDENKAEENTEVAQTTQAADAAADEAVTEAAPEA